MKRVWVTLLTLFLFLPGQADQGDLQRFETVISYLAENSRSQPSREDLLIAASTALPAPPAGTLEQVLVQANDKGELHRKVILAVLKSLDDPWARIYSPEEVAKIRSRLNGDGKAAMGVTVIKTEEPAAYRVVGVSPQGPADGKLTTFDSIVEANGVSAEDPNFQDAIRGEAGKVVRLKLVDERGVQRTETVTLNDFDSKTAFLVDRDKGLIRITSFGPDTEQELTQAMRQLNGKPAIIDLRFNGGGYVNAAVACSDLFLPAGANVVTTVSPKKTELHPATHDVTFAQPVCLLVNSRTASAAEIFTAALRSHTGAYVIGDKTYGKGSVQRLVALPGNWGLKYTTSLYQTPKGVFIDKIGLEPDRSVVMAAADANSSSDIQLAAALGWVKDHRTTASRF